VYSADNINRFIGGKILHSTDVPYNEFDHSILTTKPLEESESNITCIPKDCSTQIYITYQGHDVLILKRQEFDETLIKRVMRYKVTKGDYPDFIFMSSNGGSVQVMTEFVKLLDENNITLIPAGYCFSSCAFALLFSRNARIHPTINVVIGFHKVYPVHKDVKDTTNLINDIISNSLKEIMSPQGFKKYQITTKDTMYFPNQSEFTKMFQ
jgi:hypothetical protein